MNDPKRDEIEKRFNGIIIFFYCLLILSLPISIALVESLAGFVIFFFCIKKIFLCVHAIKSKNSPGAAELIVSFLRPKDQFLNIVIGLYICMVFASVLLSQFRSESLVAFIAKLLEGYFLYFCFVDCVKTRNQIRLFISVFVGAVFVMAADGIVQYFVKVDFLRQLPLVDHRVSATLRHANDFGAYLIVFIPMVFGLLALSLRKGSLMIKEWGIGNYFLSKAMLITTFALMLTCLGLTFSRGSWVGFWFAMIVFVAVTRKYFISVFLVSLLFLAVFLPFLMKYRDVSFTTDSVNLTREYGHIEQTPENLSKLTQLDRDRVAGAHRFNLGMGRFGFWEKAVDIIKKYPVFGSGLNTYAKQTTYYAHNCYLQMAAETGIVGLITFLALIAVLFWRSVYVYSSLNDPFLEVVLAGSLAGLAGFLLQSFFDTTLYSVQLGNLMWIIMGFIVAIPRTVRLS
jgi:putative inorganic carbon (HCO3(-)) transporter